MCVGLTACRSARSPRLCAAPDERPSAGGSRTRDVPVAESPAPVRCGTSRHGVRSVSRRNRHHVRKIHVDGLCLLVVFAADLPGQTHGERPYEMVWAGRTQDARLTLIDFEDCRTGWSRATRQSRHSRCHKNSCSGATMSASWSIAARGPQPKVTLRPPAPVAIAAPFDCINLWVYGNNWAWVSDPTTPQVEIRVVLQNADRATCWPSTWTTCDGRNGGWCTVVCPRNRSKRWANTQASWASKSWVAETRTTVRSTSTTWPCTAKRSRRLTFQPRPHGGFNCRQARP